RVLGEVDDVDAALVERRAHEIVVEAGVAVVDGESRGRDGGYRNECGGGGRKGGGLGHFSILCWMNGSEMRTASPVLKARIGRIRLLISRARNRRWHAGKPCSLMRLRCLEVP